MVRKHSADTPIIHAHTTLVLHGVKSSAVTNAVYIHGKCAEIWETENSELTLTANDIANHLPKVMQSIVKKSTIILLKNAFSQ